MNGSHARLFCLCLSARRSPSWRRPVRSLARLGLLVCTVTACSAPAPRDLPWDARFDDPALEARVAALEAEIRDEGCSGSARWSLAFDPDAPPAGMGPPTLPAGRYGFALTALDAACVRFASGCVDVDLPRPAGARVAVPLAARSEEAACDATRCAAGLCADPLGDAGPSDGGTDAAPLDAGPPDGGNCSATRADCNGNPMDGCEAPLDTPTNCGGCGTSCAYPRAFAGCGASGCFIAACEDGYADCDAVLANGCERSTRTLTDCGACDTACTLPNATADCATGMCRIGACPPDYADCNGDPVDGCEAPLATSANCGGCGVTCGGGTPLCGVDEATSARVCVAA